MSNSNQFYSAEQELELDPLSVEEYTDEELEKFRDEDLEALENMLKDVEENLDVFKDFIEELSLNRSVDASTHERMISTIEKLRSTDVGRSLIEDVDFMKNFADTVTQNSSLNK